MDDKQSAFVSNIEEDESAPNSELDLESECRPSTSEPLYQRDNLFLRNIMEEEIWLLILDKVKDSPEDAEACANATPYFRDLLWKQRKEFLFPKVIDLLAVRNEEREHYWRYVEDDDERPKDYVVWSKTVMSCRLVCHAWNKGVDKCYQKSEMSGIPELVSDPDPRTRLQTQIVILSNHWTNRKYRTEGIQDAQKFLNHFRTSHFSGVKAAPKNPFFSRCMSFDFVNTSWEGIDEYMAAITTILEMWGREIWYCYLDMRAEYEEAPQYCRQLAHWLALMPNLKYLNLEGLDCTGEMTAEFFAQNSLPTLDKLEGLYLASVGTRIVNQLLSKNNRISILKMYRIRGIDEDVLRSLANLKGLFTSSSTLGDEIMEKFGAGWKLNKLFFCSWMDTMKGAYLFQCLQTKWSDTLTELELRDPFVAEVGGRLEQSKSLRLGLPFLRSLKLQVSGSFFLDFILPSKNSLEHLKISQYPVDDVRAELCERGQIIEYVGFEEKMIESNIWELFQKLKTLVRNEELCERNYLSKVPKSKYFSMN